MNTDTTDARTNLLEMDLPGTTTVKANEALNDAPVAPLATDSLTVTPAPVPEVKRIQGVTVDQEAVRRCMADEAAAVKAGFSLKPPVYQMGRLVNDTGVANFRKSRKQFDALPLLGDACQDMVNQVAREERADVVVDLPNLYMYNDGKLQVTGNGTYTTSERAIEGLAFFSVPGGGGGNYLNGCPSHLRAQNLNHWFPLGFRVDKRATLKQAPDGTDFEEIEEKIYTPKQVTVRTRKSTDGSRGAFAVVGPRYGNFDIDKVAAKIHESLGTLGVKDARCDFTYDGYKARFDILYHTDVKPENAAAGEIFKAGIVVRAADDGSGSINVSTEIWRNRCLNLIIIDHDKVLIGRRRHSGKAQDIGDKLAEHVKQAEEHIKYFSQAWSASTLENVLEKYDLGDMREVFRGLVLNKVVTVPGIKPDDLVNKLMNAYNEEPGYSRTAVINAITRMAHTEEWKSWETHTELESTAGQLLFQKVWEAVPPKSQTVADVLGGW